MSQGRSAAPLLHCVTLNLHRLLVDIRQCHELVLLHLHVEVDTRWRHRVVIWDDDLERVTGRGRTLEDQVIRKGLIREIYNEQNISDAVNLFRTYLFFLLVLGTEGKFT